MVERRSKVVFKQWLAARPKHWSAGIEVVAMDGFTGELEHDIEIAEAVASVLPYNEATSYRTGVRFIDWLASRIGLD